MKSALMVALALAGAGAWAQGVETLRQARQGFAAACREIAASDAGLEREAAQGDAAQALQKVESAEQRRRGLSPLRQRYYLAARAYYQAQLEPLRRVVAGQSASADERRGVAEGLAAEVVADEETLKLELAAGDAKLGPQYQALKQLVEDYGELRELLGSWRSNLERGGLPEADALLLRAKVIAGMEQLVADFGVRESGLALEAEAWTQWFASLREQAKRRQATAAAQSVGQLQQREIDEALQRRAGGARATVAPPTNFAGSWVFVNLDVTPTRDAPDRVIKVKIAQEGAQIKGTYDAWVALPPGDRTDPRIRFEFEGEVGGDVIMGRVTSPSTGKITLKLRDLNTLQVDWEVVNNGRMAFLGGDGKILSRWMGQ